MRLRTKVISLIAAILILGFGMMSLSIRHEEAGLVARHQETARLLAASILTSIGAHQ